ncbi:MAG TPA: ABC transporter permease subunit, partial [Rhodospirillales bacterium]|nr:ABC transporter permease subunit [Rhodospirillales bacterium]
QSLGAGPWTVFRRVMLPPIAPGVASGALFAFATSFDEVVTILLIGGPQHRTIPREMFSSIRENISPTIAAAATLMTATAIVLLLTVEALKRRARRLKAGLPRPG